MTHVQNPIDSGPWGYEEPGGAEGFDGFEGPEKRLEITFRKNEELPAGLRAKNKEQWQELLNTVKCTIISATSNKFLDSYVLSESSLFVYPFKIVLKTCGRTTLLHCLDMLSKYAEDCGTAIEFLLFSRRNFNFPDKQLYPHCNFSDEVTYIQKYKAGSATVLGPILTGGDHHYLYVAGHEHLSAAVGAISDYSNRPVFEMLMSELSQDAMKNFYRNSAFVDAKTTTKNTGLADVLPDMEIDDVMFNPCGYSCNAICSAEDTYFTVHVTPEAHCSFVSFETNSSASLQEDYRLVEKVTTIFRPGRFSLLFSAPNGAPLPAPPEVPGYVKRYKTVYDFEGCYTVSMCNYVERGPIAA